MKRREYFYYAKYTIMNKTTSSLLTHSFPMHPFSTPLRFSDVFRGQRKGALGANRLIEVKMQSFMTKPFFTKLF